MGHHRSLISLGLLALLFFVPVAESRAGKKVPEKFSQLLVQTKDMKPRKARKLIRKYLRRQGGNPIVEGDTAFFLAESRKGPAPRLLGDFNGFGRTEKGMDPAIGAMTRIGESGWFFRHQKLEKDAWVRYQFAIGDRVFNDPHGKRTLQGFGKPYSAIAMPDAPSPLDLKTGIKGPGGKMVSGEVASKHMGETRKVQIYLPPGYDEDFDTKYPSIYFGDGSGYLEMGRAKEILDYAITNDLCQPVIGVFTDPGNRRKEYRGDPAYRAFVTKELLRYVNYTYRVKLRRDSRYLINPGSIGQPRDGDNRASFGVFDDKKWTMTIYRVAYPYEKTQDKIRAAGLPDPLADRLALGR